MIDTKNTTYTNYFGFLSNLLVEHKKGRIWEVKDYLYFKSKKIPALLFSVPVGFLTDFATIPRILWAFFSPCDDYIRGAVLHDYLYSIGRKNQEIMSRKEADDLFLEAMLLDSVNKYKAYIVYYSVRLFGGFYYDRKNKKPMV